MRVIYVGTKRHAFTRAAFPSAPNPEEETKNIVATEIRKVPDALERGKVLLAACVKSTRGSLLRQKSERNVLKKLAPFRIGTLPASLGDSFQAKGGCAPMAARLLSGPDRMDEISRA